MLFVQAGGNAAVPAAGSKQRHAAAKAAAAQVEQADATPSLQQQDLARQDELQSKR